MTDVNLPEGVCVGHFDKTFKDCRSCLVKVDCKKITEKFIKADFFNNKSEEKEVIEKPKLNTEEINKSVKYLKKKLQSSFQTTHAVVEGVDVYSIKTNIGGLYLQINNEGCFMLQTDSRTINSGYIETKDVARLLLKEVDQHANK